VEFVEGSPTKRARVPPPQLAWCWEAGEAKEEFLKAEDKEDKIMEEAREKAKEKARRERDIGFLHGRW
jgi:hypothetical protein